MNKNGYWKIIHRRVWDKMRAIYGWNKETRGDIIWFAVFTAIIFAIDWKYRGLSESWGEIYTFLLYTVIVAFGLFARKYITHFIGEPAVYDEEKQIDIDNLENELHPERIQSNVELTPLPRENGKFASIDVQNNNEQDIILYGMEPEIIDPTGKPISLDVNPNKSKLTWAGGATKGRKTIEHDNNKYLNLAEIHGLGIHFLFNSWNDGYAELDGEYKVESELRGTMGERELVIPFCVVIEYQKGKPINIRECQDEQG